MTIGERIKEIRGKKSRDVFAPETGISRTTLQNYETGATPPTSDYLNKVLELHPEISPAWLLREEGPKYRHADAEGTVDHLPEYATIDQVSAVALREINKIVAELPPDRRWDIIGEVRKRVLEEREKAAKEKK